MIILTDLLRHPIDEGAKKSALNLIEQLRKTTTCHVISANSDDLFAVADSYLHVNKSFLSNSLFRLIDTCPDKVILYIPESSITPATFVRAFVLKVFTQRHIFVLALQPRRYNTLARRVLRYIQPSCIITQPMEYASYLSRLGIRNAVLPLGVDTEMFKELPFDVKKKLREKYSIRQDRIVLLHVGHIRKERNLQWLVDMKMQLPDIEMLIVGSSYSQSDNQLYSELHAAGAIILREYIPDICEIYNLSDCYIFPVYNEKAAIGTPLSVLEAMACNLDVITTPFGSLPDTFGNYETFAYVNTSQEAIDTVKGLQGNADCVSRGNRDKVMSYAWNNVASRLYDIISSIQC